MCAKRLECVRFITAFPRAHGAESDDLPPPAPKAPLKRTHSKRWRDHLSRRRFPGGGRELGVSGRSG